MCKIKTISGNTLRDEFTAAECGALKYAANNNGIAIFDGTAFPEGRGSQSLKFEVISREQYNNGPDEILTVERKDTTPQKIIQVIIKAENTTSSTSTPAPKAEPVKSKHTQVTEALANALQLIAAANDTPATIDADEIRAIVQEEIKKSASITHEINVVTPSGTNKVTSPHPLLTKVIDMIINGITPYLVGPAGTGKTTLCKQCAEALGLPFYVISGVATKYDVEGFTDANGALVELELYKAMTGGGVLLFDEIDSARTEALVPLNNAIRNRFHNFPGKGVVNAVDNFYVIAAGNTNGRGATNTYNGRSQLDASTLDGFAFINVDYTLNVDESAAAGDKDLVELFKLIRTYIKAYDLPYTASPRGLHRMAIFLQKGWDAAEAFKAALIGGWDAADARTVANGIDTPNKYLESLKKAANEM